MVRIILNLALALLKNSLIFPGYSIFPKVTSEYPKSFLFRDKRINHHLVINNFGQYPIGSIILLKFVGQDSIKRR